jgi:phosphonatase-like hydrolase
MIQEMSKIKMIVFDMAGTTVDEGKIVYQSIQGALEKQDIIYSLKTVYEQIGGMNKKEGIRKLVEMEKDNAEEDFINVITNDFLEIVENNYRSNPDVSEMEGASELFAALHEHDIKVVLDTGYFRRTADILIDKMGWKSNGLVDFSVTSDEVLEGRPAPYMIQKAMEYFGITDSNAVAKIGDTPTDILEGIKAECSIVIGIAKDANSKDKLRSSGATHIVENLSEVLEIVLT